MRRSLLALSLFAPFAVLLAAGSAAALVLTGPRGVTVDIDEPTDPTKQPRTAATGNTYIADTGAHRIVKLDLNGQELLSWGSLGTGNGQFDGPQAVAVIRTGPMAGVVYVADSGNHRIQRFTSGGTFLGAWGSLGSANGQFNSPEGVAVDSLGSVFVADRNNNRIQKFTGTGTFLTAWGTAGSGNGQFSGPQGVTVETTGFAPRVYVADTGNHRIQRFTNTGTFQIAFGSLGSGIGQFNGPEGLSVRGSSYVYVADTNNHRIQGFTTAGTFVTVFGSMGSGPGQFMGPGGVGANTDGIAQVADTGNSRIQGFDVSEPGIPALPPWGAAVLTLALGLGGWVVFVRARPRLRRA